MMRKPRILVVDDEEITLMIVSELLRNEDYTVLTTSDSGDVVQMAQSEKPDLIVLDVYMPGRNGWSILSQLRADDHLRETPVLMLTAENQLKSVELAYDLGATSYVTKPIIPDLLKKKVAEIFSKR